MSHTTKRGAMPNITKLESISEGETDKTVTLSPMSQNLLLSLLNDYANDFQWSAETDGEWRRCTQEEKDSADAYQGKAVKELLTEVETMGRYVGELMLSFSLDVPAGWLVCDGAEYNNDDYPALFDAIGTVWGGGETTFCVPDCAGLSPQGWKLDEQFGAAIGTKMQTSVPQHRHSATNRTSSSSGSAAFRGVTDSGGASGLYTDYTGNVGGVDQRGPRFAARMLIYAGV